MSEHFIFRINEYNAEYTFDDAKFHLCMSTNPNWIQTSEMEIKSLLKLIEDNKGTWVIHQRNNFDPVFQLEVTVDKELLMLLKLQGHINFDFFPFKFYTDG